MYKKQKFLNFVFFKYFVRGTLALRAFGKVSKTIYRNIFFIFHHKRNQKTSASKIKFKYLFYPLRLRETHSRCPSPRASSGPPCSRRSAWPPSAPPPPWPLSSTPSSPPETTGGWRPGGTCSSRPPSCSRSTGF